MIPIRDYFWLRQRVPIFIYFFYIYYKKSDNPAFKGMVRTAVSLMMIGTVYMFGGYVFKIPFQKLIPLRWHYPGIITWGLFFPIYYLIILKKNYRDLTAFALATMATIAGGWMYEIPFNHDLYFFLDNNTIFILNGQIVCLLALGYELKKMRFRPTVPIYALFGLYVIFSIMCFKDFGGLVKMFKVLSGSIHFFQWVYRLPTCLFLLSLLTGITRRRKYEKDWKY